MNFSHSNDSVRDSGLLQLQARIAKCLCLDYRPQTLEKEGVVPLVVAIVPNPGLSSALFASPRSRNAPEVPGEGLCISIDVTVH